MARLPRACGLVWRPYDLPPAQALAVGRRLRALTRRRGQVFLVAGDWRLAARLGADGLHLPEPMARRGPLAPALGWRRHHRGSAHPLLSVACHGRRALARAAALDADMVTLSPVFPTASHPGASSLGPLRFAALARRAGRPVIALGGLTPHTLRRLPPGATAGAAMIGALAETPTGVSRAARALYRAR
jgi:thiamine-phosphate pyrophosphorylase